MEALKKYPAPPEIHITPEMPVPPRRSRAQALFAPELVWPAIKEAFLMLRPDVQWRNPVMFVVEIGSVLTLLFIIQAAVSQSVSQVPISYFIALDFWLWLTVLFANFATALAEARGRAQAESLRKARKDTPAYRLKGKDMIEEVSSADLRPGDRVVVEAGQIIPGDGEVIEGIASVDESAITGESAPVIREAGGDRSGRDRRNSGGLGPHRGEDYGGHRRIISRSHDRSGRGSSAPEDAQRDRADVGAGRIEPGVFDRGDSALADGAECRDLYVGLSRSR